MPEAGFVTEATIPDAEPARPGCLRRMFRWTVLFVGLLAVGIGAALVTLGFPYLRDDYVLDRIVRAVALDWRDFGEDKARQRLQVEFLDNQLGRHVSVGDCLFLDREDEKAVECRWTVRVRLTPELELPFDFESIAVIRASGALK